ncbi:MAG: hypothetical protein GX913_07260 [Clostridiales bacterium]|nr:hypothetical protein [Clostridiales bacterium]
MEANYGLDEMIQNLLEIDDRTWGLYVFSRDILKGRISEEKKLEMIDKAIESGKDYAKQIMDEYDSNDIHFIAKELNLQVDYKDSLLTGKRILFASYTPPDEILIMKEPVELAVKQLSKVNSNLVELFSEHSIMNTILGHELFHFVEDKFEEEIYTKTEKILLWNFFGFKNNSTIRTLGELGAMAFTREINGNKFNPFILDVLLYFSYDSSSARKIYHDVLGMSLGR